MIDDLIALVAEHCPRCTGEVEILECNDEDCHIRGTASTMRSASVRCATAAAGSRRHARRATGRAGTMPRDVRSAVERRPHDRCRDCRGRDRNRGDRPVTAVKRWPIATDPDLPAPTRERMRAAMMSIGEVTDHVLLDRWWARAPDHADVGPETAWDEGDPVHHPGAANGCVCRLHVPTDVLLLARQGGLVTTYSLMDQPVSNRIYIRSQVSDQ